MSKFKQSRGFRNRAYITVCASCRNGRNTLHKMHKDVILCTDCKRVFDDICQISIFGNTRMVRVNKDKILSKEGDIMFILPSEPEVESVEIKEEELSAT